jgi:hypothetical protein
MAQGPTLEQLQQQGVSQPSAPAKSTGVSRVGYAFLMLFVAEGAFWVVGAAIGTFGSASGHSQADMDKHLNAWKAANKTLAASESCGDKDLPTCRAQWKATVAPNLTQAETDWAVVQADIAYEFNHRTVSNSCQIAYADMRATLNEFYPVEDKIVTAFMLDDMSTVKQLAIQEAPLANRVKATAAVDSTECKNF